MSKGTYVGVSGVAHKVKKIYAGMGGVAHKVKKVYVGVNGVAKLAYSGSAQYKVIIDNSYSTNSTMYETISDPPINAYTSIINPLTTLGYGTPNATSALILYDKKRDQFILCSQLYWYRSSSSLVYHRVYVKKSDATTWTSVGNLPEPSGKWFQRTNMSNIKFCTISIDDDGNFFIPVSSATTDTQSNLWFAKYYIENNTINLVGITTSAIVNYQTLSAAYMSKIGKLDNKYCVVYWHGDANYHVTLYTSTDPINTAWTANTTFFFYNNSRIIDPDVVDKWLPVYKYNGVYYTLGNMSSGSSYLEFLSTGTTLETMKRKTRYLSNMKLVYPYAFKDNKAYFATTEGISTTTGYTTKGVYSILLDSASWDGSGYIVPISDVCTKESDSNYGIGSGYKAVKGYFNDGKYIIIIADPPSGSGSNLYMYYTQDIITFTAVDISSTFGTSAINYIGVAFVPRE